MEVNRFLVAHLGDLPGNSIVVILANLGPGCDKKDIPPRPADPQTGRQEAFHPLEEAERGHCGDSEARTLYVG